MISAVYKIVNTITKDCYVGSSRDVYRRWAEHKKHSVWKRCPNNPLYLDMQKFGINKFRFQILAPVMPEYLKRVEQELIEMLQPTYNKMNSCGLNVERQKASIKKYRQTEKGKETKRKALKKYRNQLCTYNGETLTLYTLATRLYRAGIKHSTLEAKKYLQKQGKPDD